MEYDTREREKEENPYTLRLSVNTDNHISITLGHVDIINQDGMLCVQIVTKASNEEGFVYINIGMSTVSAWNASG